MSLRRVLGVFGVMAGTAATFAVATVSGVLLHINLPAARRVVAVQVNGVLASTFHGKLAIQHIGRIGFTGLRGVSATLDDPDGKRVAWLGGVNASIDTRDLVRSLVREKGNIRIFLPELSVDAAEVSLDPDSSGALGLARAFESVSPSPPDAPPGRGVHVGIPNIALHHVWIHGAMAGAPPIDAEVDDAVVAVLVEPGITIDLKQAKLVTRALPRGANPHGDLTAHVAMPSATGQELGLTATFAGDVAGIPATVNATMDGSRVDAVVDVTHASRDRLRALAPEVEWGADGKVHVEAHGTLPRLAVAADVTFESAPGAKPAKLHAAGDVRIAPTTSVDLTTEVRDIDVRAFSSTAPASDLSADVKASIRLDENGEPQGTYDVHVLPGEVAAQRVPSVKLKGKVQGSRISVRGHVDEPGAPTEIIASFNGKRPEPTVKFETHTHVASLDGIRRVGPIAQGSVDVHTRGVIKLGGGPTVDARVDIEGRDIEQSGVALRTVHIGGRVTGELTNPFVDASIEGDSLDVQDRHFSEVAVQVRGPVMAPVIGAVAHGQDETRIEVGAAVQVGDGVTLRDVRLDFVEPEVSMISRAERIHIGKAGILVEDTVIRGLGAPMVVRAERNKEGIRFRIRNEGLDLTKVSRLARLDPTLIQAGTVDCNVDLVVHPKGVDGTVALDLKHAHIGAVEDASAKLQATFDDKNVVLKAHAGSARRGSVDIETTTLQLPGSPLDPDAWEKVIGKVHIASTLDIDEMRDLIPKTTPFRPTDGNLLVNLDIERDEAHEEPDLTLSVRTEKLALQARRKRFVDAEGNKVVQPPAWQLSGVDFALDATVNGEDGKSHISAKIADANAPLLQFEADGQLPYHTLVHDEMAGQAAHAIRLLERSPWSAKLTIPRRRLDTLPALLGTKELTGEVDFALRVDGTVLEPRVGLVAHAIDVKRRRGADYPATSIDFLAQYNAGKATMGMSVRLPAPHHGATRLQLAQQGGAANLPDTPRVEVFALHAEGNGKVADFIHPPKKGPAWDATAYAKIKSFPLESVAFFSDRQMRGNVSGEFEVRDLHRAGRAHAEVRFDGLHVGKAEYTGAKVSADVDNDGARAHVRFDQKDGFAQVDVRGKATWGAEIAPAIDRTKPIESEIKADGFRIAALLPFLQPTVSDIDGRVHADARVYLPPPTHAQTKDDEDEERPTMEGNISLRDGSLELPILGEKLQGLQANVVIERGGRVRIDDIEARTDEGHVSGEASVRLAGLKLMEANASFEIPRDEAFPISLHGEELGEAYGKLTIKAAADPRTKRAMNIDVNVPEMHIKLPDTSSHDVLDLDRAEKIRVGVYRKPKELTLLPLTPLEYEPEEPKPPEAESTLTIRTKLGHDVEVRRGSDIRIQMTGDTAVTVNSETKMTGQLRLTGGNLEVQGKRFEIEKGTVTFTGEPANPVIAVTAGWTAPQGTRVYADYIGPLKTGKVNLRSEPARSQNDILALILYGTDQGGNAPKRRGPNATTQAVGMGGGFATQGLNKALEGITGSDVVSVRLDTSSSANPRPEVEFQISRRISLQLATVFGRLPFDQPDRNLATVDWRFRTNWSVETTVGDKGSSMIDLIWQRRY